MDTGNRETEGNREDLNFSQILKPLKFTEELKSIGSIFTEKSLRSRFETQPKLKTFIFILKTSKKEIGVSFLKPFLSFFK